MPSAAPDPLARAAAALRARRPADALPWLEAALRQRPDDPAILHDLGLVNLELGRLPAATAAFEAAIAARPSYADAHLRLGIAREYAGAAAGAIAAYRQAIACQPSLADAQYRLGELLEQLGLEDEAAAAFRAAAAPEPGALLGRVAAGRAARLAGDDGAAIAHFRAALAKQPENAAALSLLGHALLESGAFEEARSLLLRAIARDPRRAGDYDDVAACRPFTSEDRALIGAMQAAARDPSLPPIQLARIHLAIGKAADDAGDAAAAMTAYDKAAALRDRIVDFDLAAFEGHAGWLIDTCTPAFFAAQTERSDDPAPILIVGLPRSGTTLLERIFAAHPMAAAGGEMPFWNEHGAAFAGAISPGAAAGYLARLRRVSPKAARITDKMPLNFRWVGLIHACLPRAMFLHCRRNVLDTALSIHRTHFNARFAFPTGGPALVGYIRAYQRLVAHWRAVIPESQWLDVDYEDLVRSPTAIIPRVIAACGLPWDNACLAPERAGGAVRTPSAWQVRQPISDSRVGRWRRYDGVLGSLSALAGES